MKLIKNFTYDSFWAGVKNHPVGAFFGVILVCLLTIVPLYEGASFILLGLTEPELPLTPPEEHSHPASLYADPPYLVHDTGERITFHLHDSI